MRVVGVQPAPGALVISSDPFRFSALFFILMMPIPSYKAAYLSLCMQGITCSFLLFPIFLNLHTQTQSMDQFSHIDSQGKPAMVNVSEKKETTRTAVARSIVVLPDQVLERLENGEITTAKGVVFQTAVIAGIMAAKKTGELIPLCHPLGLDNCEITIQLNDKRELLIDCRATINAKTGVEMEALVGASIAALTVYDMCKALSHDIVIKETKLMEKTGGKRDFKRE
jgi:cyclic pyranopterin phosphate synthase